LLLLGQPPCQAQPSPAPATPQAVAGAIGDARLVGFGEAVHGAKEILAFRDALFEELVERHGFTAIALETGFIEARAADAFVQGETNDIDRALADGFSWTFDQYPQNRALLRWARDYNSKAGGRRKIHIYGFDMPGSPGNPDARRGLDTALAAALAFLAKVDPSEYARRRGRLDSILECLRRAPGTRGSYTSLSSAQRRDQSKAIMEMVGHFERKAGVYRLRSSAEEFAWAERAVLGARDIDIWLQQMALGWDPSKGFHFLARATDVRDRAQADNIRWLATTIEPAGKLLVFAHQFHLSRAPLSTSWWGQTNGRSQIVAGSYLQRWFGPRYLSIGTLIGGGRIGCSTDNITALPPPSAGTIDAAAVASGRTSFVVDLRSQLSLGHGAVGEPMAFGRPGDRIVAKRRPFALLVYFNAVSPACEAPMVADVLPRDFREDVQISDKVAIVPYWPAAPGNWRHRQGGSDLGHKPAR
jgi:erythromycin esterase